MTIYNWSALNDGDVFGEGTLSGGFSAGIDELAFDGGIAAADVLIENGGSTVAFTAEGKTVTLDIGLYSLTTANLTFGDGSVLIVGDDNTGVVGDDGANTLTGGSGNDQLIGGAGDDRLIQTPGNEVIDGGDGQDVLAFVDDIGVGVLVDLSAGITAATDVFNGRENSAAISGIEHVFGTAFNDTFIGGDPLHAPTVGNGEVEIFHPSDGNDVITGAAGDGWITAVDYSEVSGAVTVTLGHSNNVGSAHGLHIGADVLKNVDQVRGGAGNDLLIGGSYATLANGNFSEHFRGNAGNDTLNGDGDDTTLGQIGDNDTAEYQNSPFAIFVNLGTSAIKGTPFGTVAGGTAYDGWSSLGGGIDKLIGIDVVRGSAHNDTIVGGGAATHTNERLIGDAGDDRLIGVNANDEADYSSDLDTPGPVLVDLGAGTASDGFGGTDTLVNLFWARGGNFDDTVIGANGDLERLMGGRGDDRIDGGGTAGVSYAGYQSAASAVAAFVENGSGSASDGEGGTDTLVHINGLWGSNFNDALTGGAGKQWFRGRGGSDTLEGGSGIDTVNYSDPNPAGVIVNLAKGTATDGWGGVWGLQGTDTLRHIENVEGSSFNDRITGDAGANRLEGRDGNDTLDGGAGADTLVGGLGNDLYVRDALGDALSEGGNPGGIDTVRSAVNYTLGASLEKLILTGTAVSGAGNTLSNSITGNGASNHLYGGAAGNDTISGGAGNDAIDGGTGNDSMAGGTGDDLFIVDATGDHVTEAANGGETDTVLSSVSETLDLNVENLQLTGTALNGTGNASDNKLIGNARNNLLDGRGGTDQLVGLGGNDTMVWGAPDSYDGGAGIDTLKVLGGSLNLTALKPTRIHDVEQIDLTGGGNNRLTLTASNLMDLSSSSNTVKVLGSSGDSVDIVGTFRSHGIVGGYHSYDVGAALLLVDPHISVF